MADLKRVWGGWEQWRVREEAVFAQRLREKVTAFLLLCARRFYCFLVLLIVLLLGAYLGLFPGLLLITHDG